MGHKTLLSNLLKIQNFWLQLMLLLKWLNLHYATKRPNLNCCNVHHVQRHQHNKMAIQLHTCFNCLCKVSQQSVSTALIKTVPRHIFALHDVTASLPCCKTTDEYWHVKWKVRCSVSQNIAHYVFYPWSNKSKSFLRCRLLTNIIIKTIGVT